MNPEVKKKWLEKLRDPEVKQAKGCLKNDNGFCCLGVLTDIYIQEHKDEVGWVRPLGYADYQYLDSGEVLPEKVMEWAGLTRAIGGEVEIKKEDYPGDTSLCDDGPITLILPEANDLGMSFSKIAEYIEKQL